jgi:hypothetical protein
MATHPPLSVAPLINPMRQRARFYGRLVAVLVPLTAVLAVLAGFYADVGILAGVLVVGCSLGFAYTCGALMARSAARGVDRQLEEFRRGQVLVVWHCSAEEWRRFAEAERGRVGKVEGKIRLLMVAVFAVFGIVIGAAVAGVVGALVGALIGAALGLAYDEASGWRTRATARRRYRHARRGGGPTYLGAEGVYTSGEFHGWNSLWEQLQGATFFPGDPPYLHLLFGRPVADSTFPGATQYLPEDLCIPVPACHEAEARQIVELLEERRGVGAPRQRAVPSLAAGDVLSAYPRFRARVKGWARRAEFDPLGRSLDAVLESLQPGPQFQTVKESRKKWKNLATFLGDLPGDLRGRAEDFLRDHGYPVPQVPRW